MEKESTLLADQHLGVSRADDADDEAIPALTLRRRSRTDDDMDLTPMVDVTFQLLIFFMVTASFALQKSIEVPTPDPDKKGATQQLQLLDDLEGSSIRVQIDASNSILIDEEPLGDLARLPEALKDKMRKEQKTEILITAHALALHRSVISVIDAANGVGMQKIRLVSRQGKSE
jgi:biopolymer transport protein ExbD